jgi:DnaJ family protein C protein 13
VALFQGIAMLLNPFLLFSCIHLKPIESLFQPLSGVEIQCIGHFRLLFGLLSVDSCKPIQCAALNVISSVTQNQECVNDIAASDVLVPLLLTLYSLPDAQVTTLEILYALMHTTKIVKDALIKGEPMHSVLCKKFF